MKAEDLELLEKLGALDSKSLRDISGLVDILLCQSSREIIGNQCESELGTVCRLFDFPPEDLRSFLLGLKTLLSSSKAEVRNLLAASDFCLMSWVFKSSCCFDLSCQFHFPFTFYLLKGRAQICVTSSEDVEDWTVTEGDVFQSSLSRSLRCYFHAGSKAIFFDFPFFRGYRRSTRFFRQRRIEDVE
ncbi:MAG TPA: hypothetical protein VGL91_25225 [Acidobacteriota bacterium]